MENQDRARMIWRLIDAKHQKYRRQNYNSPNVESILTLPENIDELAEGTIGSFECHVNLLQLDFSKLQQVHQSYEMEIAKEAERQHDFNRAAAFATPDVIDFFSRAEFWSIGEAAALINERNPKVVTESRIETDNSRYVISKALKVTLELLERARSMGTLNRLNRPLDLIQWTMLKDIQMPSRLVELTLARGKTLYDTKAENKKLKERIAELELLESAQPIEDATQQNKKPIGTRERSTLLKLFIGLCLSNYGNANQIKVAEIKSDLDLKGINFDDGTIRKYLDEAKELIARE